MKLLADATLPNIRTLFGAPFSLVLYHTPEEAYALLADCTILFCRSTLKLTEVLLANTSLECIATASSGTEHIPTAYARHRGIHVFDAKGANAHAVADYVTATLALLYRAQCVDGNRAGVIGVGEVGSRVVRRLQAAGFKTITFDPLNPLMNKKQYQAAQERLFSCDLLCIHADLHHNTPYPSYHLLDSAFLNKLKKNVIIINAARGAIVHEQALLGAKKPIIYCTDVYENEPSIDPALINYAFNCTPHIAGHSIEAKQGQMITVCEQLHRHYQLPMPGIEKTTPPPPRLKAHATWQETILSIYDPSHDTHLLKAAADKRMAFLVQRKAHQHRHDFNYFDSHDCDAQTKIMLGD